MIRTLCTISAILLLAAVVAAEPPTSPRPDFAAAREAGRAKSMLARPDASAQAARTPTAPTADLAGFQQRIAPLLQRSCVPCHGPDTVEGNLRIDTLNPNLLTGPDIAWWLEVSSVVARSEMPPPDADALNDADRAAIMDWLSAQLRAASEVQRAAHSGSAFRRLTRYELNYALQDLLGQPFSFARDLPPEPFSKDGFQNSAELLQMSASQFEVCRESFLKALQRVTVRGERPALLYWGCDMHAASANEWARFEQMQQKLREEHATDPAALERALSEFQSQHSRRHGGPHYLDPATGLTEGIQWGYGGAQYAWPPQSTPPAPPQSGRRTAIVPAGRKLTVELGDQLPDAGPLLVRVRAACVQGGDGPPPELQLEFGWQASNDSQASMRISELSHPVNADPQQPGWYEWRVPLDEIEPRNLVRGVNRMGETPSPSELIRIINTSDSRNAVQIDYVEVVAPAWEAWPPASHTALLGADTNADEQTAARQILSRFLRKAWRVRVEEREIERRLALFNTIRPQTDDFQEAMLEVLATVLASPRFLYLGQVADDSADGQLDLHQFATRLSLFLWCSVPDDGLLELADNGTLGQPDVLRQTVRRMLADPRSSRLSQEFVRQWLGLQLLGFLKVDRSAHAQFDERLHDAMQAEPAEFFREILSTNASVLDLLHADYAMVNQRLARHYGLANVVGSQFRRVPLPPELHRGGLLTQAGLLAMNSDGLDSHPLKRGIWLLERILNDPPPPPPPAVPRIDLADPEILKLTLKQRLENHRSQPACYSCHARIDPWGIAFEQFDAVGSWRTAIRGKPVDAAAELYNRTTLDGVDGLKTYLLEDRQDQFIAALTARLAAYGLGRPLKFSDHAQIEQISGQLRAEGDGMATLIEILACSQLFRSR
jgi:mono/diheme cytochrome c family protein